MATRPHTTSKQRSLIRKYTVQSAGTVTKGMGVKLGTLETDVLNAGANEKAIGIALESGVAGAIVEIAMLGFSIEPVLVGTNGAAHGEHAIMEADGFTSQTLGGGNTVRYIEGVFLQTGVAGDYVGLLLTGRFAAGSA